MLSAYLRERGEDDCLFPVHRLDKETEGLMVYARHTKAAAALSRSLTEGNMQKEYVAVVCGIPEKTAGELTDRLFYDHKRGKSFVVDRMRKGVKEAKLTYTVLETKNEHSLLHIALLTGRTHQIRVQFASRGLPLAGDRRYGAPEEGCRLALCAYRLRFPHPATGEPLSFCILPSSETEAVWQGWHSFGSYSFPQNIHKKI